MKELRFIVRGGYLRVDPEGRIKAHGTDGFSDNWRFLGGSRHHWRRGIDIDLAAAFKDPSSLNGCLGWDRDHGTVRQWRGSWNGRLPRIGGAYVIDA